MSVDSKKYPVEVCLSPIMWELFAPENAVIIVTDIFRASTSIVAAFQNKVKAIIPVALVSESIEFKERGYLVAGERDGKKLDFTDYGNSPFEFMDPHLTGQTLVMTTSNGTRALKLNQSSSNLVAVGAFTNRDAICQWAMEQNRPIIIICAGWKNKFSIEDTLFAGAAVEYILEKGAGQFYTSCDSANASKDIWKEAKKDPILYVKKAEHFQRLKALGADDMLEYSMTLNTSQCLPVLQDGVLIDMR